MWIFQTIAEVVFRLFCLARMLLANAFILLWNVIVFGLLIGGFVLWWGFLFSSVIALILVLIFAPHLFFLPGIICYVFIPFVSVEATAQKLQQRQIP